jgi:dTDP-4-dehydrorhamnose 3,5-epimerase
MNSIKSNVDGARYFESYRTQDNRGRFTKLFSTNWPEIESFSLSESFYSDSVTGVLRGMHLQTGSASNDRFISLQSGKIFDVLIDLRPQSATFLEISTVVLSVDSVASVFVPAGVAHGFQALEHSRTLYLSSKAHKPESDAGVDALTIDVEWPIRKSMRSDRDLSLPSLSHWLEGVTN